MIPSNSLKMHILGNALYVDVDIWNKYESDFNASFLTFDTGATITTISSTVLESIGYDVSNGTERQITTGSGTATVREITVDKLRLGANCIIDNVKVYAHNFPDECFTIGVLGLNVLALFDIQLKFSCKLINLAKIQ
jgi:predicted aspartyl protease